MTFVLIVVRKYTFLKKLFLLKLIDPDPNLAKILDPDPNSMYLDPQHWLTWKMSQNKSSKSELLIVNIPCGSGLEEEQQVGNI